MKIKNLAVITIISLMLTACGNADSTSTHIPSDVSTTTTTVTTTTTTSSEPTATATTTTTSSTDNSSEPTVTTTTATTSSSATTSQPTTSDVTTSKATTTTKKKTTTTTKATTTKPKTTTTKATTTTPRTTTTTTTTTAKPPENAVKMYCAGGILYKKYIPDYDRNTYSAYPYPEFRAASGEYVENYSVFPKNSVVSLIEDVDDRWSYIYYNGRYGYVGRNSLSRLPIEQCAEEVCMYINELRASLGLNELRVDDELCEMAAQRSAEQSWSSSPAHAHVRPDGSWFDTIFEEYGWICFEDYYYAAENIQSGSDSARGTFNSWYTSEGHYNNMVCSSYTAMGLSRKPDGTGAWVLLLVGEEKVTT